MKRLGLILSAVVMAGGLFCRGAGAAQIQAQSRVQRVVVYPDSAVLTRTAQVKLAKGPHQIIFPDIIPDMDENSLRVSAEGPAGVVLFGAQVRRKFLEEVPSERIKALKEEIQNLEDAVKDTESLRRVFMEQKEFLDSVRLHAKAQIPQELVTKMPQPQELEAMLKFLDVKLRENAAAVLGAERNLRGLRKKMETLQRELGQISGAAKKLTREISVDIEAEKAGPAEISVSYLVRGASWMPVYDARADFEKSQVELISYGIVRQRTGEDWNNVDMALSTARPAVGGNLPYISPWILRPFQPPAPLGRGMADRAKTAMPQVQTEAFLSAERDAALREEAVYARAEEKGIAVLYTLPGKTTAASDGAEHKLAVSAQKLKAEFEYSSYPRAAPAAYLGSRVQNGPGLQLLAGRVNIFLEGDFVGTSSLGNIGPAEKFDLYLGADENVKVKRELVEKKASETIFGAIPASRRRTAFTYKLTAENYKSKQIKLKLFEAVPVSEDDRIKVRMEKAGREPDVKDWQDRKGVWLWELKLEPKQKQEITYTFVVEHPRDMIVEGL